MKSIQIERSPDNKPAIGIGGGSYTKSFHFRIVMQKNDQGSLSLKPARFIRAAGDLACKLDQGYVEIGIGDVVIEGSGYLPIEPNNNTIMVKGSRITAINQDLWIALADYEPIGFKDLPYSVIHGAGIYHNRDGSYFCDGVKT